jgi:hypothetical protein
MGVYIYRTTPLQIFTDGLPPVNLQLMLSRAERLCAIKKIAHIYLAGLEPADEFGRQRPKRQTH